MLVSVSNPFLVLCSLLSCENVLSDNQRNKGVSICTENSYITGQTHWESCSLLSGADYMANFSPG